MSGGRKFTSDTLISAEERLDEIERKYAVIQERIQSYDCVLQEFEVLKKQSNQLQAHCDYLDRLTAKESENLFAKIKQNAGKIDEVLKANEKNAETITEFANNHHVQLGKLDEKINDQQLGLFSLSKYREEHSKRIDKIHDSLSSLKSGLGTFQAAMQDFSASIEKLNADHSILKKEFSEIQAKFNENMQKFALSMQKMPDFKDWAAQVLIRSDESLDNTRSELINKIESAIQSVRKELREDPLTVNFIKKEFKNALESLSLDSKNAYLKSHNCAQQVQILEKKIETINLTLKKYELSK